jgi:hypothetical protein
MAASPNAAGAGLDEDRFARLQTTPCEQAVMSGPECDRQRRGDEHVEPFRHQPRPAGRDRTQLRVRPSEIEARHLLAHLAIVHVPSDRDDFAGGRIADDESRMRWRRGRAIDQVTALDSRSLDADQDAIAWANGIGHIRVVKDIRRAGAIIDGCFHGYLAPPSLAWGKGWTRPATSVRNELQKVGVQHISVHCQHPATPVLDHVFMDRCALSVKTVEGACRNVAKRTGTVPGQCHPKFGLRRQKVSL